MRAAAKDAVESGKVITSVENARVSLRQQGDLSLYTLVRRVARIPSAALLRGA